MWRAPDIVPDIPVYQMYKLKMVDTKPSFLVYGWMADNVLKDKLIVYDNAVQPKRIGWKDFDCTCATAEADSLLILSISMELVDFVLCSEVKCSSLFL